MTKTEALYSFWSSFGLPAYDELSVPMTAENQPDVDFPYLTYQTMTDSAFNSLTLTASIWDRSTSWDTLNTLTDEISQEIGLSGVIIDCDDNGALWIKRGTPFAQSMGDDSDRFIKRKVLNINIDFFTHF